MKRDVSKKMFIEANRYMPGGVNSPVRAFKAVGGDPIFIAKGAGSTIWDVDDNAYIDYVLSWGALILGHAHPAVVSAVTDAVRNGMSFGAPTDNETRLAKKITEALPSVESVRFVNSGTEAVMSAIRLARAYTQRSKIIKFEGCYHGHADSLLVKAGSGVATLGLPNSPGVTEALAHDTIVLPFNDSGAVAACMQEIGDEIACVIVEPVPGNMGVVPPQPGFLELLREVTAASGALLIFDEVMTGFRVAYGGAQTLFGITPDLTCLGKIIGGGMPVGAYGGRREIMDLVAPAGSVYQAGTLSGNPVAMAAGLATLDLLAEADVYDVLDKKAAALEDGFIENGKKAGIPIRVQRVGSMLTLFFSGAPVGNYTDAVACDTTAFSRYFTRMLERGVYLAPSAFEALFLSIAHSDTDIEKTIQAQADVFAGMKG